MKRLFIIYNINELECKKQTHIHCAYVRKFEKVKFGKDTLK